MIYDPKTGIYKDCKWCGGRGCVYCPGEADKEYERQFPNGPQPIATFDTSYLDDAGKMELLRSLIGPEAIMAAKKEGELRAKEKIEQCPEAVEIAGATKEQAVQALTTGYAAEILEQNIIKAGLKAKK